MKQVSYSETETFFAAGTDVVDARKRHEAGESASNPLSAWEELDYWAREERSEAYEVFKFVTTTQVTKVDPPHTRSTK